MQALQIGVDLFESGVDVVHVLFLVAYLGDLVVARRAELVAWHYIFVDEILDHDVDEPAVFIVRDSATLVDVRHQDLQHLVRHFIELVHLDLELPLAGGQLFGHKALRNVPADGTEPLAVARDGVEQRDRLQQTLELLGVLAVAESVVVELGVAVGQYLAYAAARLDAHLESVLQDADGELGVAHSGDPQPEVLVHAVAASHVLH